MKVTVITIIIGAIGTVTSGLIKGVGELGYKSTRGDHINDSIVEIG